MRLFPRLALYLFILSGCVGPEDWQPLSSPVPAPDFTAKTLDGHTVRLSDYRGQVVVMEFWATWCTPCRYTLPSVDLMYRKYRDRGVQVLLINQQEDPEKISRWMRGRFESPVVLDVEGEIARKYNVRGIPRLFIIDTEGQILYAKSGYSGGLERQLNAVLEGMLSEGKRDRSSQ